MKIVVVPNHLPNLDFLKSWRELKKCKIIVVQDIGSKPEIPEGFDITIYDHEDIKRDLGENDWIIPSRTSACRSYGYYKAWQLNPEMILTLDNDCYPERSDYWVKEHEEVLSLKITSAWTSSLPERNLPTRGFPYKIRGTSEVVLSHGLWSNVPDFDGIDMLKNPNERFPVRFMSKHKIIPKNNYYPMCGMNVAWKTKLTPCMYFNLQGSEYGFDQYDDIFAGVFSKKIIDYLGWAVISGTPTVEHRKQSNPFVNLTKQAPGLLLNENLWKEIDKIQLTKETVPELYEELAQKLPDTIEGDINGWLLKQKKAMVIWANLFK